jgi:ferredoxin-thioredoxin reductase catalytic subunit
LIAFEYVRRRAESDARSRGYYLNSDENFLRDLLEGLKKNEERYSYPSCPCRLASGEFDLDKDIICPCDYRDPDVEEFGNCYCGLYVKKDVFEGKASVASIRERRPLEKQTKAYGISAEAAPAQPAKIEPKLWYCRQCGYVVFREEPPYVCPICKAKREFFAELRMEIYGLG